MPSGFDFEFAVNAPFRMQPGLRRAAADARRLTPSTVAPAPGDALAEKLDTLAAHADRALLCRPDFDPRPALERLSAEIARDHPDAWRVDRDGRVTAVHLGWTLEDGRLLPRADAVPEVGQVIEALPPAWRLPALLGLAFEEDLAIVDGRDATVPWMAVCLPSFWAPETKAGRHFVEIHLPVPDADLLRAAGARLMKLACGPERWERFVWTLTPHRRLRAHPAVDPRPPWPAGADPDAFARAAHLRTERQAFIPMPDIGQAVFTIHVRRAPLAEAIVDADRARRLRDALATMSDAVLEYRGLTDARAPLLAWLARRAQACPG
ncbi:MAG: DUF3445 domain-containing protein [Burkholderiaceae bacterium]